MPTSRPVGYGAWVNLSPSRSCHLSPLRSRPPRAGAHRPAAWRLPAGCFYGPSVAEPSCAAKANGWEGRAGALGWGAHEDMLETLERGLTPGPWLLSEQFSMADVVVGGTIRWMLAFKMLEARPAFVAYAERLGARPANVAAAGINARVAEERGPKR